MYTARFSLIISPEDFLAYYRREKELVRVTTFDGYSLQFRAEHLRAWVRPEGVAGIFEICFDERRSFQSLTQIKALSVGGNAGASRSASVGGGRQKGRRTKVNFRV
ncbi:MAG: DUF2835 family protein [Myxococcota bacterium]|nr:DUF2835 family protein [Myxococcota bacterium]